MDSKQQWTQTDRPVDQHQLIQDVGTLGDHVGRQEEQTGVQRAVDQSRTALFNNLSC